VSSWQHTIQSCLGRAITREEVLATLGRALLECFEEIAPGRSASMYEVYREYQARTYNEAITEVAGTQEVLQRLKDEGLLLGVVTSKSRKVALEGMDLFGLAPVFDTLVTYEDTTRHKPNPAPLLVAAQRLHIDPAAGMYVGDAMFDILAGKAAGMQTAGVTWGAATRDLLAEAEADYIVDNMEDLLVLVKAVTR
jgi:pyrophosphatase PpaX